MVTQARLLESAGERTNESDLAARWLESYVPSWSPDEISGLTVWLDAVDYTSGETPVWPNKGTGAAVSIEGLPPMSISANTLNGLPLVKFIGGGGRVRGVWSTTAPHDYTLLYLLRWSGVAKGRAFTAQYPPSNMLIGMHTSAKDAMYDNGVWIYGPEGQTWWSTPPGPWRMYGADSSSTVGARFFIDGVFIGGRNDSANVQGGLYGGWGLSGYGAAEQETMDIEVAEMVLYDRKLTDAERIQVEDYLNDKWFPPAAVRGAFTYFGGNGTSATINKPACSVGDVLVWFMGNTAGQPVDSYQTPDASAGAWILQGQGTTDGGGGYSANCSVYTRVVTGTEGSTFQANSPSGGQNHSLAMVAISNAKVTAAALSFAGAPHGTGPLNLPGVAVPAGGVGLVFSTSYTGFGNSNPPDSGPWTTLADWDPAVLLEFTGTGTSPTAVIPFGGGDTEGVQISVAPN